MCCRETSEEEMKYLIEKMKEWTKKVTVNQEAARNALFKMGLIDKKGNLTKHYR